MKTSENKKIILNIDLKRVPSSKSRYHISQNKLISVDDDKSHKMSENRIKIKNLLTKSDRLPQVDVQDINLNKTSQTLINDMKHNFSSLPEARKYNFNTLYSKTSMNKFKKNNQILTRNILT